MPAWGIVAAVVSLSRRNRCNSWRVASASSSRPDFSYSSWRRKTGSAGKLSLSEMVSGVIVSGPGPWIS